MISSSIPAPCLLIHLHQAGCLGAGGELVRQRRVDFLYSSTCCLVFVTQERMTGRGLHWLYAGIACQYPFLQLLF